MGLRERRESADVLSGRLVGYCRSVTKVGWGESAHEGAKGEALLRAGRLAEAEEAFVRARELGRALAIALELADAELDPHRRLHHLARAVRHAPEGTDPAGAREVKLRYYRARRALLGAAAAGSTQRNELAEIGRAFEALDALDEAARTYREAGDDEARLRVLVAAGEIDGVEEVLASVRGRESSARKEQEIRAVAEHLWATGQRDQAARTLAGPLLEAGAPGVGGHETVAGSAKLLDRLANDRARVRGTRVVETFPGSSEGEVTWVFGERVVVGRADDATIRIPSPLVSRRHLVLFRGPDGGCELENVGASTLLAGAQVGRRLSVYGYTKLELGPVHVELWPLFDTAEETSATAPLRRLHGLRLVVGGAAFRLALGPMHVGPFVVEPVPLPPGVPFSLDQGDGLRLRPEVPAAAGGAVPHLDGVTACPEGIDLLRGDRITVARGGLPLLRILG
jgi:tetratricopeptide (TPR) repeat protein